MPAATSSEIPHLLPANAISSEPQDPPAPLTGELGSDGDVDLFDSYASVSTDTLAALDSAEAASSTPTEHALGSAAVHSSVEMPGASETALSEIADPAWLASYMKEFHRTALDDRSAVDDIFAPIAHETAEKFAGLSAEEARVDAALGGVAVQTFGINWDR